MTGPASRPISQVGPGSEPASQALSLLIVDDHPVVREGLRGMLTSEPDIEVVGEAGSAEEAVTLAKGLGPDVILMDLRMPGTDGADATARILAANPAIRVLVLTTYDTDRDILRAVEAGAIGYLLKDTPHRPGPGRALGSCRRDRAGSTGSRPAHDQGPGSSPRGSHRPRGRGAGPGRPRAHQRPDRPQAVHRSSDSQDPPPPHLLHTSSTSSRSSESTTVRQRLPPPSPEASWLRPTSEEPDSAERV